MEAKGRSVLITGAVAHGQRPRPAGRLPDLGHRLQGRLSSSARSTSATRSGASSIPALKRMKPSPTASLPQRARRSALECRPPKLVASATSSQAVEEGVGAGLRADVEADDRAHAGPAHVADVVAGAQRRRPARARWPPGARGAAPASPASGAPATPRTAPGSSPWRSRHARSAAARSSSATATAPMIRSLWPARCLEALITEKSAPSSSGRWRSGPASVLSTATTAPRGVGLGDQRAAGRARRAPGWRATRATRASRPAAPRARRRRRWARAAPRRRWARARRGRSRGSPGRRPTARRARRRCAGPGMTTALTAAIPAAKTTLWAPSSSPSASSRRAHVGLS